MVLKVCSPITQISSQKSRQFRSVQDRDGIGGCYQVSRRIMAFRGVRPGSAERWLMFVT